MKGFFYCLKAPTEEQRAALASIVAVATETRNGITFVTVDLMKMNQRIRESLEEINLISEKYTSWRTRLGP